MAHQPPGENGAATKFHTNDVVRGKGGNSKVELEKKEGKKISNNFGGKI